jgi:hypothetical protein
MAGSIGRVVEEEVEESTSHIQANKGKSKGFDWQLFIFSFG